jgi:hypothetical protein
MLCVERAESHSNRQAVLAAGFLTALKWLVPLMHSRTCMHIVAGPLS